MDETRFLELSQNALMELCDLIDNNDEKSIFDVEYSDGILTIEIFDKDKTYVINKHSASEKIWYSSPISGADYFSFDEESKEWRDKNDKELSSILINELTKNFNFNFKNDRN
jgi:iron donor protein CyaY